MSSSQAKVQRRTLKGHRKLVLCLAHSSEQRSNHQDTITSHHHHYPPCLLLSGSEDGTARLWDLRSRRTSLCMIIPTTSSTGSSSSNGTKSSLQSYAADQSSVNCVAFHPLSFTNTNNNQESSNPCMVYATTSNRIHGYDIRQYTTPIVSSSTATTTTTASVSSPVSSSRTIPIVKTPNVDLTSTFQCNDEINQLSFSYPNTTTTTANNNNNTANATIESSFLCMATVDDSGEARVVTNYDAYNDNLSQRSTSTVIMVRLQHAKPETLSIASCAAFRPPKQYSGKKKKSNNNNSGISYLATAGTDCTIKLWDIDTMNNNGNNDSNNVSKSTVRIRHRPPTSTITFGPQHENDNNNNDNNAATSTTMSTTTTTTMKLCNPPYIHSLSWSISGKYLAAGIGDGSISIIRAEGHRLVKIGRFCNSYSGSNEKEGDGHTSAVAAVHFPSFERVIRRSSSSGDDDVVVDEIMSKLNIKNRDDIATMDEEDRLLISAGNDGNIIFWDIGSKDQVKDVIHDSQSLSYVDYLSLIMSSSIPSNNTHDMSNSGAAGRHQSILLPSILFRISHGHKPNWITSNRSMDAALPNSIFVADTTNNISVYTLPNVN